MDRGQQYRRFVDVKIQEKRKMLTAMSWSLIDTKLRDREKIVSVVSSRESRNMVQRKALRLSEKHVMQ